jgi:hypothetical protein
MSATVRKSELSTQRPVTSTAGSRRCRVPAAIAASHVVGGTGRVADGQILLPADAVALTVCLARDVFVVRREGVVMPGTLDMVSGLVRAVEPTVLLMAAAGGVDRHTATPIRNARP